VVERKTAAGAGESVQRDIAELRSAYDTADRRMTTALEAVHRTLEKVVERLADLETDDPSKAAKGQPAAPPRDIVAELINEVQTRGQTTPVIEPQPIPEPAPLPVADKAAEVAKVEIDKPVTRQPLMPDLPADFPLEPGAAPRQQEMTPTIGTAETAQEPPAPLDARSSFIAAARRAAQAAAAEAGGGKAKAAAKVEAAKPASPKPAAQPVAGDAAAIDVAAPSSDKGVGARVSGLMSPAGLQQRIRDLYVKRRRPILIGLAALVLALGSIQAARLVLPQLRQAPAATPATVAPAPVDPAKPAADPAKPAGDQQGSITPATRGVEPVAVAEKVKDEPQPAVVGRADTASSTPAAASTPSVPSLNETMAAAADLSVTTGSVPAGQVAALPEALEEAVNKGVPRALFDLGSRLADAKGKQRDLSGAAILYRKAAEEGFVPAQYRLAAMYEKGVGIGRDTKAALDWYRRAADGGNVKAMHNMAVLYAEGAATGKPDYAQAAMWFKQAAEHGLRDSQYNLAILTARGLGVTASLEGAYQWFSLAANQGDEDAGRKRDEVATKLDAATLAKVKTAVTDFEPKSSPVLANEETLPTVNWDKMTKSGSGA
jgi:localization factor PodJL